MHVIAVYIPSGGAYCGRCTEILPKLLTLNAKILEATPDALVIFLGDWNVSQVELGNKLQTPITGLTIHKSVGSALSRFPTHELMRARMEVKTRVGNRNGKREQDQAMSDEQQWEDNK